MSQDRNIAAARQLLAHIGDGRDPEEIAALFSADAVLDIPGDHGVLPWIGGRRTGRDAVAGFFRDVRTLTEPVRFDVQDILGSEQRAVILGELATRIKATGAVIESPFAIILTVSDGEITGFRMLEDSFEVSRKARA